LSALVFKVADQPEEFEKIHRLNYQAFVEEIPQHQPNPEQRLVDKFHAQNTYIIGLADQAVVAMVALRDQRPFSLDQKLENLDSYLPPAQKVGEIRLLYIVPAYRNATVFRLLLETAAHYVVPKGWELAVISGTTRQQRLYRHFGFVPFGPLVGQPGAEFQPMYWTVASFRDRMYWLQALQNENTTPATSAAGEA
jgi:GNAT superfamily N-acetyltransferase